jgi:hypothetical protein
MSFNKGYALFGSWQILSVKGMEVEIWLKAFYQMFMFPESFQFIGSNFFSFAKIICNGLRILVGTLWSILVPWLIY